jgi:hypothetical protein
LICTQPIKLLGPPHAHPQPTTAGLAPVVYAARLPSCPPGSNSRLDLPKGLSSQVSASAAAPFADQGYISCFVLNGAAMGRVWPLGGFAKGLQLNAPGARAVPLEIEILLDPQKNPGLMKGCGAIRVLWSSRRLRIVDDHSPVC